MLAVGRDCLKLDLQDFGIFRIVVTMYSVP